MRDARVRPYPVLKKYQLIAGAVGLLLGCGNEDPQPKRLGDGSAILTDRARILDEAGLRALLRATREAESIELAFSSVSPVLEELRPGDVLIVGSSPHTPEGALLKVTAVTPVDSELVVQASAASLGEAFEKLALHLDTTLTARGETDATTAKRRATPSVSRQALGVTLPFSLREGSGENQVELSGSLALDPSIDLALDFDFTEFALKELSLTFRARETFTAELSGIGQVAFQETADLASIGFTPITLLLPIPTPPGVVPVVLTPRATLEVGFRGSIQGEVQASVFQQAGFTAGLGYRDGEFGGFSDDDSNFENDSPTYGAAANARAWGGPRLEVLLYGAVGPFAGVEAFAEFAAEGEGPPPCARGVLDAGLRAKVGVNLLAKYEATLFDKRYPLAQFDSCTDDPNAPRPAITWARSYGRVGSSGEQAKAVLAASDGTYLVVGDSGLFEGISGFAASTWVMRLDALGNLIWQRAFQRVAQHGLSCCAAEVPGGFLIAGTGGVLKLDSGGNPLWAQTFESNAPLAITSMAAHEDGGFVVAGHHGTSPKGWIMRLNRAGEVVWSHVYAIQAFARVRVTTDGGYVLTGNADANNGDVALVKLDADGQVRWARGLDNAFDGAGGQGEMLMLSSSGDQGFDVVEKPEGGYIAVGESYGNYPIPEPAPGGYYATWIAELDAQGELSGAGSTVHRVPQEAAYGGAYAAVVRPNGSALVVGRRADTAADLLRREDVLLIHETAYSALGGAGNDAIYGGNLAGVGRGMPLQATADGGAIVAATSNSFADQDQFWLAKLNRTASLSSPYRVSLAGASYTNEHAISSPLNLTASAIKVTANTFLGELSAEATEVSSAQQSP